MDFIDQLQELAAKASKICDLLQTEEATKNALVMPFIKILGYDIFDPTEVIPEFIAVRQIKNKKSMTTATQPKKKIDLDLLCINTNRNLFCVKMML